jgi:hypothetical protein
MEKLQEIIEKILKMQNISPSSESYYLKLKMVSHDDYLVIGRVGEQILVGLHDDLSNPVLSYDYNQGDWFPIGIENKLGNTICSFIEDGKRMIIPYRIKRFMLFQKMMANNIRGFLENGVKQSLEEGNPIQEAIVSDVFLISKNDPSPFIMGKCKNDYANPNKEEK